MCTNVLYLDTNQPHLPPQFVINKTDVPPVAGDDSRVIFETTLSRSLGPMQFLLVVPLSAEGAETQVEFCLRPAESDNESLHEALGNL
jgi:hypothetical protein